MICNVGAQTITVSIPSSSGQYFQLYTTDYWEREL